MQHTYLNTASCGIVEPALLAAAYGSYGGLTAIASTSAEKWRDEEQPIIRSNVARFLDVPVDNVALIPNFSWAMNGILHSLHGNEKVLLYKGDYPSVLEPFRINRFDIAWIDDTDGFMIDAADMKQRLLAENIDMLVISHVQWNSGFKVNLADIGAFCHAHDIWFIVDATQSLGAVDINIREANIDVLIASNYKWMNAGFGTGVMYMSDAFLQEYIPAVGGNNSYTIQDGRQVYIPGVRSYEPGHPNVFGLTLLNLAILHRMEQVVTNVEAHNRNLTQLLLDNLAGLNVTLIGEASMTDRASIIFLQDRDGLSAMLKENGIVATFRGPNVRISMHYYNTEEEVLRLVEVLKKL